MDRRGHSEERVFSIKPFLSVKKTGVYPPICYDTGKMAVKYLLTCARFGTDHQQDGFYQFKIQIFILLPGDRSYTEVLESFFNRPGLFSLSSMQASSVASNPPRFW